MAKKNVKRELATASEILRLAMTLETEETTALELIGEDAPVLPVEFDVEFFEERKTALLYRLGIGQKSNSSMAHPLINIIAGKLVVFTEDLASIKEMLDLQGPTLGYRSAAIPISLPPECVWVPVELTRVDGSSTTAIRLNYVNGAPPPSKAPDIRLFKDSVELSADVTVGHYSPAFREVNLTVDEPLSAETINVTVTECGSSLSIDLAGPAPVF